MRHGYPLSMGVAAIAIGVAAWFVGIAGSGTAPTVVANARIATAPGPEIDVAAPTIHITATSTSATAAAPTDDPARIAAAFLGDINDLRADADVEMLARDAALDAMAQSWADTMADDGSLRHSTLIHDVVDGPWVAAGENIGYGPDERTIFAALENSPGHLANIVNADYSHVGIGVRVVGPVVWTAHVFAG